MFLSLSGGGGGGEMKSDMRCTLYHDYHTTTSYRAHRSAGFSLGTNLRLDTNRRMPAFNSGTSNNGRSEEWTTSIQWTNCSHLVHYSEIPLSFLRNGICTVEPPIMDTLKSGQPPYNGQTART